MDIRGLTSGNWIKETNRFDYDERQPMADLEFQIPEHASFIVYKKEDYQPIPLTGWLKKFGFKIASKDFWYNDDLNYHYNPNSFELFVGCDNENGYKIPSEIKWVHQIQNLHYDLSGQELKLVDGNNHPDYGGIQQFKRNS